MEKGDMRCAVIGPPIEEKGRFYHGSIRRTEDRTNSEKRGPAILETAPEFPPHGVHMVWSNVALKLHYDRPSNRARKVVPPMNGRAW